MKFKAFVTRQYNGDYMMTRIIPEIAEVEGTKHMDAYVAAGDGLGMRGMCKEYMNRVFENPPEATESRRVRVTIEEIGPAEPLPEAVDGKFDD